MDFEENQQFRVVINHEEQYSIWPDDMENAIGWQDAGPRGTKQHCLAYIGDVWTDMRPLSLRKAMGEMCDADHERSDAFVSLGVAEIAASRPLNLQ